MQPPWFYCPELTAEIVALDSAQTRHALVSLRLRPGDTLVLFDGCGQVAAGHLQPGPSVFPPKSAEKPRHGDSTSALVAVEKLERAPPPERTLTLIVAACKGPRLDWMVEKLTELGATRIVLADFERSVVHVGSGHLEKLRRIAIEACKQCGRAWLPEIQSGLNASQALASGADGMLVVADPDESAAFIAPWLHARASGAGRLIGVVGPEGGMTQAELDLLMSAGGERVRLAEHTLRVETAAVSLAAVWAACATPARHKLPAALS